MIRNYIAIAWRNMKRQRFYSFINIAGLATGIMACLIIVLFVTDELSYDHYNTKLNRIYRIDQDITFGGNLANLAISPAPLAHALQQEYPEIESTTRFLSYGTYLVRADDNKENSKEQNVIWTDSTFFSVFSVPVIEGDSNTALTQPASIAISRRTAEKYFPNTSAVGKSLLLDNKYHAQVTAVYENIPSNSHFHFDILISLVGDWPAAKEAQSTLYQNNNFNTYLLLKDGVNAKALEEKLPKFVTTHVQPSPEVQQSITLMPLADIHLHSQRRGELEPNGNIVYVYLFLIIAFFILVIACINFMNLSTARFGTRAKEVGVRKVMGSPRSHLIGQFLMESTLITSFAVVAAILLASVLLPAFNVLMQRQLQLPWTNLSFYVVVITGSLCIGLLAGIYPSFFLSEFKPVDVLKGRAMIASRGVSLRSGLVIFQFFITIFLLVGTITINKQLSYIQNKRLGFEKDNVLIIKDAYALRPNIQTFREQVERMGAVSSCSISGFIPAAGGSEVARRDRTFWSQGLTPVAENLVNIQQWSVDTDYIKTFKMRVLKGRDFSDEFPSDVSGVVLNEAAALQFNLGDDPIGKKIITSAVGPNREQDFDHPQEFTVLGVVEDFHFSSLQEGISPLGLFLGKSDGFISVRFQGAPQDVISSLQTAWTNIAPGQPFQYSFLDDEYGKIYASEERLGEIFMWFSSLAMLIACLGLFALTTFMGEQRAKEIGIRKVLGATVNHLILLLFGDFGKLIIIAFILSVPLSWYAMNEWLNQYVYKTELDISVFAIAGSVAFIMTLLTIGYQSLKSVTTNPIDVLKEQ